MATTTTQASWTENQTALAASTLDSTESTTGTIDLAANGYDVVSCQLSVTFGATPDSVTTLDVFASPDSGTTDDNVPITSFDVQQTASSTRIVSFVLQDLPFVNLTVTNKDSADTITSVTILYAGRKWDNA